MDDPSALIDEEKDVLRILQSTSDDVMLSESVNQDSTVKEEEAIVDRIEYDEEDREGYTAIVAAGRKDEEILEGAAIGDVDVTDTQVTSDDDDDDDEDDGVVVHVSNSLPTRRLTMTKFTDRGQRSYVRPQLRDNSKVDVVEIIKKKEDDEIRALRFSQQRTAFDVDIDALDAHPWRKKNANLSDYFNYGFDEDSWKVYCEKQLRLRAAKGLGPFIPSLMTSAQSKPMSIVSLPPSTEYKVENKSMTPLIKTESFRPPPPSEVKNHPPKAPPPPGPHQPTFLDKPSQNHQTNQFNNNSIQATNFTMDGSYPFQQFPPNFQPSAPPIPMMFYPPNQPPMFPGGMIPGPPDNLEPSRYQSSDQDRRQRDDSRHRSRINQDSNYGDRDNYKIKYNENYKDSREIKRADSRPRERHRSGDRKVASTRKNRSRSRDKRR